MKSSAMAFALGDSYATYNGRYQPPTCRHQRQVLLCMYIELLVWYETYVCTYVYADNVDSMC